KVDALVGQLGDGDTTLAEQVAALEASLNEAWENIAAANNTIGTTAGNLAALIGDNASAIEELWNEIASEDANSIRTQLGQVTRLISEIQAELVTIKSFCSSVKSLVFIPEVYVDGVEGLKYGSFAYNALTLKDKDKQTEIAVEATDSTVVNPVVYAKYHVNPRNADIESIKNKLSFYVRPNVEFISSRAAASTDFAMTPEFHSYDKGILTVKVNITGVAATDELISVFALNIDSVNVTSDYATLYKTNMTDIAIADATDLKIADNHYRRAIKGIDAVDDEAKIADKKPWSDTDKDVVVDTSFVYTGSLDLNTIVKAHGLTADGCTVADIEDLGFAWKYEVVENYAIGTETETFQGDFVNLSEDGVLTAKVYDTTGRAAIGRTPIIRVSLVDTNNDNAIVKCAYIKVRIVDTQEVVDDESIVMNVEDFVYNCAADTNTVTVKEINLKIYNELGLSFEQFTAKYPNFVDYGATLDPAHIGTVTSTKEQTGSVTEATDIVTWIITADELWENAGDSVEHKVRYYTADSTNYVQFVLKAKIAGVQKEYNIEKANYITNYWDADKTYTKFNVAVPSSTTDEDPANCTFVNNLNSPFVTWPANSTEGTPGILKLDKAVTGIQYFFCAEDVKAITEIGGIKVNFTVSEDGLTLYADTTGMTTKAVVATINNADTEWANVVEYNKNSNLGKTLLNTGAMYTYIGAKGRVCDDDTKEVAITFDGEDHFKANFIRPVDIAGVANDEFIDAVDFGEEGSYIALEDLINPTDWRGREFSEYENYWGYYGPFEITVDTKTAMCDLNNEWQAVPTTVVLEQVGPETFEAETDYGFLTYKNNGTNVKAFNVYVKVTVKYGWGVINTDYIKVPVASTIAAE
ncbi:MAG: hypothetical protein IJ456_06435, partial [Bacteroides sp.]|nr:hypothetical protein [Bacteroides sp.]